MFDEIYIFQESSPEFGHCVVRFSQDAQVCGLVGVTKHVTKQFCQIVVTVVTLDKL